jgi:WD40 repeat protein
MSHRLVPLLVALSAGPLLAAEPRLDALGDPLPIAARARIGTLRLLAPGPVHQLSFSADGKLLFSLGGDGGVLQVWEPTTGREVRPLKDLPRCVNEFTLSPNGRMIAVRDDPNGVRVWDLLSGRLVFTHSLRPKDDEKESGGLAFAPDSRHLAIASGPALIVLDLATGKPAGSFRGQNGIFHLTFSADGKFLAGATQHGVTLWDRMSGKRLRRYGPYIAEGNDKVAHVWTAEFGGDGRSLLVSTDDGLFRALELDSIEELKQTKLSEVGFSCAGLSADRGLLATGDREGLLKVWRIDTGKVAHTLETGTMSDAVAFAPGNRLLATGDSTGRIRLWDLTRNIESVLPGPRPSFHPIGVMADGKTLVAITDTTIQHHDLASSKLLRRFPLHSRENATGLLSPDARVIAVLSDDESLSLIDVRTGKELHTLKIGEGGAASLAFSPDGQTLALAADGSRVRFWSVETGKEKPSLGENKENIALRILAYSPDGRVLFTGHPQRGLLRRWELATARQRAPYQFPAEVLPDDPKEDWTPDLKLSPDGKFAAVKQNKSVYLCSLATGRVVHRIFTTENPTFTFSPDGKLLATISDKDSNAIALWDTDTGTRRCVLKGHIGDIRQFAFTPDGRRLISAATDDTCLIWDVEEALTLKPDDSAPIPDRKKMEELWDDLGSDDAVRGETAIRQMESVPNETTRVLRLHLKPIAAPDAALVPRLIEELDDEKFQTRQEATKQLEALGDLASSGLEAALKRARSKERSRRIEALLERLERPGLSPEQVRQVHAVEVLERINTTAARELLAELAKGAPDARLTREAKSALERMRRTTPMHE